MTSFLEVGAPFSYFGLRIGEWQMRDVGCEISNLESAL
jgi:hypothetical protein